MQIIDLLSHIKPGETVVVEHDSTAVPSYVLYILIKDALNEGKRVLIDDFMDTLHIYKTQLELAGVDVSIFDEIPVIKIGGIAEVGKIVGIISPRGGTIIRKEYERIYTGVVSEEETTINPVLGLEKVLLLSEDKFDLMATLAEIYLRLGDKRRIAIYFINRDVLKNVHPVALPIIEFMATTLIEVEKKGRVYTLEVLKSITPEIDGKTFNYDLDRLEG
ncbi:DUF257 family protein [Thermococcus alcaliphilus]|uniref:DUF257 family protein n=1 Tax=Thermococcus alcaliphilus TaxID=139207 RepID=UPI002090D637|nr:DUF257 family protein [Thermococcus alcaliphilus]MCO6041704.1 DUF257 domain-containing protein [Thermococcus alcaliphilus]